MLTVSDSATARCQPWSVRQCPTASDSIPTVPTADSPTVSDSSDTIPTVPTVPTARAQNYADLLTKGLPTDTFHKHRGTIFNLAAMPYEDKKDASQE